MPSRPTAISISAWVVALAASPLVVLLALRPRARALYALKEPHFDFFFFHEAKGIYLNLAILMAAFAIFFLSPTRVTAPWEFSRRKACLRLFPWVFFLAAAALALPVFQNTPLTLDEYAAVFQAKLFAAGRWSAQLDPDLLPFIVPRFLQNYFLSVGPQARVIETYLPGYALMLSPFAGLGLGWLFNPTLGAAILFLLIRLAQKHFDDRTAFWVALLALASPIFWVNSLSFYSLNCRLFFNLAFLYFLLPGRVALTARSTFLAGLCGGAAAFSHNPFPHAVFALPWLIYFVSSRERRSYLGPLILGYLPGVAACVGWYALLYSFQTAPNSASGAFTYGWDVATAVKGPQVKATTFALWSISFCRLLLWCAPGVWIFFFSRPARATPFLRVAAISFLFTVLAYGLARNRIAQGFGWGHRYSYASLGALLLVAAVGLAARETETPFRRLGFALVAAGLFVLTPLRLWQAQRFIRSQRGQVKCLPETVKQVCFLDTWGNYYAGDRVQNDPLLRTARLMLHSQGPDADNELMAKKFPDYRLIWREGKNSLWTPR